MQRAELALVLLRSPQTSTADCLPGWELCCITTYVTASALHRGIANFLLELYPCISLSVSAFSCHSCVLRELDKKGLEDMFPEGHKSDAI